jgi:hypothetical protein
VQALVPKDLITRWLGDVAGIKDVLMGCPVIRFAATFGVPAVAGLLAEAIDSLL